MSGIATAIIGSAVVTSYATSKSASKAAEAQVESSEAAIEEQRRQFDEATKILSPYVEAGGIAIGGLAPFQEAGLKAFQQQQALSGLLGPEAQRAAISTLEESPEMQALVRQGEEALLQRASATGGLRGGNVQAALAQFRPQMLSRQIETQLGRLGGFAATGLGVSGELVRYGQASAARQAAAAGQLGTNVGGLLQSQGAAQAGAALAQGQALSQLGQSVPNALILSRFMTPPAPAPVTIGGGF